MGQSTSVERGTSSSARQRPCLEKSLLDKDRCEYRKDGGSNGDSEEVDQESVEKGSQVYRSYHVKDRIDSLIEEYLTENTSTHDSDCEDNAHAVSSTEDTLQDPSSSSVTECDQGEVVGQSATESVFTSANGLRTTSPDADRKSDIVDSTNAPPDSELDNSSTVGRANEAVEKVLKNQISSPKMESTSSLSMYTGSHVKHTSPLSKSMCGSSSASETNLWKSNTKKQIKLQTFIDRVLESSLGSPTPDEGSGLLKSLSDVENDEKEINRLSSSHGLRPMGIASERPVDSHRTVSKTAPGKGQKVDLGCSKDHLESFKTHIQKAVTARFERDKPTRHSQANSPESHIDQLSASKHKTAGIKTEMPVNHNHSRHQDIKGIFNVQQIIEKVIKEADLQNEFGDDRKRNSVQPPSNVPYSVHPSHLNRENMLNNNHRHEARHSDPHSGHRDYRSAASPYGSGPHSKVNEEPKRGQAMYPNMDRHHNSIGGNRDYRYDYGRNRASHHPQIPHSSPSRDLHPSRSHSASYHTETGMDVSRRKDSFSHKSYKRHSPPPLVRISDSQGTHAHRQQFPHKFPSDHCLPPPAKIRKEHYPEMESSVPVSGDVSPAYRAGQRMQLAANTIRGPDNLHMRPVYPMPVQMGLPFRGTLGPLPGPRSAAWIGGPDPSAIQVQQLRHPHPGQPVHVTPRYPISKHPNGIMPQRLSGQMLPGVVRESAVPPQHSMALSNQTPVQLQSVNTELKLRPPGSITKGTAPPPPVVETNPPQVSDTDRRPTRQSEDVPLDLSKKPTASPSPAASSTDGQDSRLPNGEPNCMSTHIKSLEKSVEKYFHDYNMGKVPLDRLQLPEGVGDHQIFLQQRLMAEAHVHAQAQAHAHAIAQAQAHAQAQEQAHAQAKVQAQAQAQAQARAQAQMHVSSRSYQMHSPTYLERTPSRETTHPNSPRPPRQESGLSPRQTSPHPSVIQSPPINSIHGQDSQHHQKVGSAPSPLPGEGNKSSAKSMKQISKHEPIQSLLGNHAPSDILYLICRLCGQTYGSPYGFRKHFRNQHGFEPQAHHTQVQTISETRSVLHQPGRDGGEMPALEMTCSPSIGHLQGTCDNQALDRLSVVDQHSPVVISDSLAEQKSVIVNGATSDSRPSSSLSATEVKSDSSSVSEDKCTRSKLPLAPDLQEAEERRFMSCHECGEKFQLNDFGLYKKHCRAHDRERQGKVKCTDCRSSFCESHQIQEQAYNRQGGNMKGSHLCHLCNFFFPNPTALSQHIEMDHRLEEIQLHDLRQEQYSCVHCKKHFKDLQNYVDHQQHCPSATDSTGGGDEHREIQTSHISSDSSSSKDEDSRHQTSVATGLSGAEDTSKSLTSSPGDLNEPSVDMVWKKKKSAIKLSQPESSSTVGPIVNGDSRDSLDDCADLYRHKKFSRHPTKRRDSDLESLDSVSSNKKMKLDIPAMDEGRRASSCSSTAPSPAGSSVRSACSSPNSAVDEPSVKTDFKKHSKFAKGMKYVSRLNNKDDSSPSRDRSNCGSKSVREKSKCDEGSPRPKRGDKRDKGKKTSGEKAEARHQLPFVWDRITRSKAVKHAKK